MTHTCSITKKGCDEPFPPFGDSDNYPCEHCSVNERLIITVDKEVRWLLLGIVGLDAKCIFCGDTITKDNIGGVFNKPNRVSCTKLCCIMKLSDEIK